MRKRLVFMCIVAGFFLNSCAAVGLIAGGGTLACVAYEEGSNQRCPAIVEIDESIDYLKNDKILAQ